LEQAKAFYKPVTRHVTQPTSSKHCISHYYIKHVLYVLPTSSIIEG